MNTSIALALVMIGLMVGVLNGAIGIGGVLLVPALTYIGGLEIHVAIASTMISFFFSGSVGTFVYARRGSIRWTDAAWLGVGAVPGAFLGAAAVSVVSGYVLELLIAALIIASALNSLLGNARRSREPRVLARGLLVVVGIITGVMSSMTGTGGPLVLIPILLWMQVPVLAAVGLGQAIQLPIAALATAGNVAYGTIDVRIAAALSVLQMIGVWFGAGIAHRISSTTMRQFVLLMLLAVGVMMLARIALRTAGA